MKTIKNLVSKIQQTETVQRLQQPSPDYFKPIQKVGLGAAGIGLVIKLACVFFPATMPVGLAAIGVNLLSLGLTALGISKLPVDGGYKKK